MWFFVCTTGIINIKSFSLYWQVCSKVQVKCYITLLVHIINEIGGENMINEIKNREFTLGDIFSAAWNAFRSQFISILVIILIVYIPVNIIISFIPVETLIETHGLRGFRLYLRIIEILESLIGIIATMALAFLINKSINNNINNDESDYKEALGKAVSRWGSGIWTNILAGLIIFGLTLLLIIPGIIWSNYYTFIVYVVILKNLSGKEALDYSKSLVEGYWWRIFGISILFGICNFILGYAVGSIFEYFPNNQLMGIFSNTITDLLSSFFTIAEIILFLNMDYLKYPTKDDDDTLYKEINY